MSHIEVSLEHIYAEACADFGKIQATTTLVPLLSVFSYVIVLLESIPRESEGETKGIKDCCPVSTVKEMNSLVDLVQTTLVPTASVLVSFVIGHCDRPIILWSVSPTSSA